MRWPWPLLEGLHGGRLIGADATDGHIGDEVVFAPDLKRKDEEKEVIAEENNKDCYELGSQVYIELDV